MVSKWSHRSCERSLSPQRNTQSADDLGQRAWCGNEFCGYGGHGDFSLNSKIPHLLFSFKLSLLIPIATIHLLFFSLENKKAFYVIF